MRILSLLLPLALLMGCGPIVTIPGGALSGDVVVVPGDWKFTDAVDTVQLETRPDDPYSVNIWVAATGDALYFATSETEWAGHIAADSRVRLRVDGKIYELKATRTDSASEREAVLAAMKVKYDFEPDSGQESTATLYRLEPR